MSYAHQEEVMQKDGQVSASPHQNNNNEAPVRARPASQLSIEELKRLIQQKEKEQLIAAIKERQEKELKELEQGVLIPTPPVLPTHTGMDDIYQIHEHTHTSMPSARAQHTHSATTTRSTAAVASKRWTDQEGEDEDGDGGDDAGVTRQDVASDMLHDNERVSRIDVAWHPSSLGKDFSKLMISLDKAKMDKFDGNNTKLNILEFLQKLDDLYTTYDVPPEKKVQVFKKFCTGDAYYWIEDILRDWAHASRQPIPYDVLLEKAYKQYTTPMTIYDKKDFLSTIRQFSDENSKTYCNRIKRLARAKGIVEDRLISDAYWQGLREPIKGIIGLKIGFDEIEGLSTLQMSEMATQAEMTLDKLENRKFIARSPFKPKDKPPPINLEGLASNDVKRHANDHTKTNTDITSNVCYICGETGHYSNLCPNKKGENGKTLSTRFNDSKPEVYMTAHSGTNHIKPAIRIPSPLNALQSQPLTSNTLPRTVTVSNVSINWERDKNDYTSIADDNAWTYEPMDEDNEPYASDGSVTESDIEEDIEDVSHCHKSVCAMSHDVDNTYRECRHTTKDITEQENQPIGQSHTLSHDIVCLSTCEHPTQCDLTLGPSQCDLCHDPMHTGFDPTHTGFDPIHTGFDPIHTGFDPIHTGFNRIRVVTDAPCVGIGPNRITNSMHSSVDTLHMHVAGCTQKRDMLLISLIPDGLTLKPTHHRACWQAPNKIEIFDPGP
jgi:hypothetical protein